MTTKVSAEPTGTRSLNLHGCAFAFVIAGTAAGFSAVFGSAACKVPIGKHERLRKIITNRFRHRFRDIGLRCCRFCGTGRGRYRNRGSNGKCCDPMGVLQSDDVVSASIMLLFNLDERNRTNFLNETSATRSRPPANFETESARKTLPVVAIATMWECSESGFIVIGSGREVR